MTNYKDFRKDWDKVYTLILDIAKNHNLPLECFDCGKELTPREATFMVDNIGFLIFCPNDAFARLDRQVLWRKIFRGK